MAANSKHYTCSILRRAHQYKTLLCLASLIYYSNAMYGSQHWINLYSASSTFEGQEFSRGHLGSMRTWTASDFKFLASLHVLIVETTENHEKPRAVIVLEWHMLDKLLLVYLPAACESLLIIIMNFTENRMTTQLGSPIWPAYRSSLAEEARISDFVPPIGGVSATSIDILSPPNAPVSMASYLAVDWLCYKGVRSECTHT